MEVAGKIIAFGTSVTSSLRPRPWLVGIPTFIRLKGKAAISELPEFEAANKALMDAEAANDSSRTPIYAT